LTISTVNARKLASSIRVPESNPRLQGGLIDLVQPAQSWLAWFLATLGHAVDQAQPTLDAVLAKMRFWQRWAAPGSAALNERQAKLVNRLLDGFEGKLTSRKWAAIAKCSPDTALRDITDLLARGVLRKSDAGGCSTGYELDKESKWDDLRAVCVGLLAEHRFHGLLPTVRADSVVCGYQA